jgi:hypothetical protein
MNTNINKQTRLWGIFIYHALLYPCRDPQNGRFGIDERGGSQRGGQRARRVSSISPLALTAVALVVVAVVLTDRGAVPPASVVDALGSGEVRAREPVAA